MDLGDMRLLRSDSGVGKRGRFSVGTKEMTYMRATPYARTYSILGVNAREWGCNTSVKCGEAMELCFYACHLLRIPSSK